MKAKRTRVLKLAQRDVAAAVREHVHGRSIEASQRAMTDTLCALVSLLTPEQQVQLVSKLTDGEWVPVNVSIAPVTASPPCSWCGREVTKPCATETQARKKCAHILP